MTSHRALQHAYTENMNWPTNNPSTQTRKSAVLAFKWTSCSSFLNTMLLLVRGPKATATKIKIKDVLVERWKVHLLKYCNAPFFSPLHELPAGKAQTHSVLSTFETPSQHVWNHLFISSSDRYITDSSTNTPDHSASQVLIDTTAKLFLNSVLWDHPVSNPAINLPAISATDPQSP